jgi:hypothetical protein
MGHPILTMGHPKTFSQIIRSQSITNCLTFNINKGHSLIKHIKIKQVN